MPSEDATLYAKTRLLTDARRARARLDADPYDGSPVTLSQRSELTIGHDARSRPVAELSSTTRSLRRRLTGELETISSTSARTLHRRCAGVLVLTCRDPEQAMVTERLIWSAAGPAVAQLGGGALPASAHGELEQELTGHLGPLSDPHSRMPLLDAAHRDAVMDLSAAQAGMLSPVSAAPWIGAADCAEVARRAFGPENYRKPLARAVSRVHPDTTAYFAVFAGLAPIDNIVSAMDALPAGSTVGAYITGTDHGSQRARLLRALLNALPAQIVGRMLTTWGDPADHIIALREAALGMDRRAVGAQELAEALDRIGQRKIRRAADLAGLIASLGADPDRAGGADLEYEARLLRELQTANAERERDGLAPLDGNSWSDAAVREDEAARQRQAAAERALGAQREAEAAHLLAEAERIEEQRAALADDAAWHDKLRAALLAHDGGRIAGLDLVLASRKDELVAWSQNMHNCIKNYHYHLGIDVFGALLDPESGKMLVNFQINPRLGVLQILVDQAKGGPSASYLTSALDQGLAQRIVDELAAAGALFDRACGGNNGLRGLVRPKAVDGITIVPEAPEAGTESSIEDQ